MSRLDVIQKAVGASKSVLRTKQITKSADTENNESVSASTSRISLLNIFSHRGAGGEDSSSKSSKSRSASKSKSSKSSSKSKSDSKSEKKEGSSEEDKGKGGNRQDDRQGTVRQGQAALAADVAFQNSIRLDEILEKDEILKSASI